MEKIRLKNGNEFDLIPMGIDTREQHKLRYFKILANQPYNEVLTGISNENNLIKIEHILTDGSVGATYTDYVAFKSLTYVPNAVIDDSTTADIYVIVLSMDAVERALQEANNNIHTTMAAVDMLLTEFLPMLMD